jgi:hypothetical protein
MAMQEKTHLMIAKLALLPLATTLNLYIRYWQHDKISDFKGCCHVPLDMDKISNIPRIFQDD